MLLRDLLRDYRGLYNQTKDADFKESDHPRGQPDNPGQFVAGGGSSSKSEGESSKSEKSESKEIDISSYPQEAKEIDHEQRMAQAEYSDVTARMSSNLKSASQSNSKNTQKEVSGKIDNKNVLTIRENIKNEANTYSRYLATDTALHLRDFSDNCQMALTKGIEDGSLKDIDASYLNQLGIDSVKKMIHQEVESNRQAFTDHGIRHIMGDIERAQSIATIMKPDITGKELLLLSFIGVNHDIGYTTPLIREGGLRSVMITKDHPAFSEKIAKEQEDQWDKGKIFTKEEYDAAMYIIKTHDTTEMSAKDPLGSAFRISDNLSLFSSEKLPGAFRYVESGDLELIKMGVAARDKDQKKFDDAKEELSKKIDGADLNTNLKRDLKAAIGEMGFLTPKFTMGVLAGEVSTIEKSGDRVEISIKYDPYDAFLQKFFDMGQKQTRKFLEDYGITDFTKTSYDVGDLLKLDVIGYRGKQSP